VSQLVVYLGGASRERASPDSVDADNHVKHFKDAPEGIKVLDSDGKMLPAVRDVLKIADNGLVAGSSPAG
jgi:hypothetical protein